MFLILAIIYQILDTGSFSVRVVVYPSLGNSFLVDAEEGYSHLGKGALLFVVLLFPIQHVLLGCVAHPCLDANLYLAMHPFVIS
jgi:hypothetical protein